MHRLQQPRAGTRPRRLGPARHADERTALVGQLAGIDLAELDRLVRDARTSRTPFRPRDRLAPVPTESAATIDAATVRRGHEALARGEVAVLLVAGGQGSRLGFDKPKGMFPIGPVSDKTLFQIHAEKVLALGRRYGKPVPFLVMTSPATHADTESVLRASNDYFGLPPRERRLLPAGDDAGPRPGDRPAAAGSTGRAVPQPERPRRHADGPGRIGPARRDLQARGVRHVFYFQVDNPLVKVADPAFLGRHIAARSEASSKVVAKAIPKEKLGVLALIDGRCGIIEYSDLPDELAHETRRRRPAACTGPATRRSTCSPCDFLRRVTQGATRLPFHVARKKVPHLDAAGQPVSPTTENALKFELFVFDALPLAERWLVGGDAARGGVLAR